MKPSPMPSRLTQRIVWAMVLGILVGIVTQHWLSGADYQAVMTPFIAVLQIGGSIFLQLIRLLVVPVVLLSLVCGVAGLDDLRQLGRMGGAALALYLLTSMLAIAMAMLVAGGLHIGVGLNMPTQSITLPPAPSWQSVILNFVPANPFAALVNGHMIQVIVLALMLGVAAMHAGTAGRSFLRAFEVGNQVMMALVHGVIACTPIGVFCLLAVQFNRLSPTAIWHVLSYFLTVLGVLALQVVVVYSAFLLILARFNPWVFFYRCRAMLCFAFSVSSSSASIPVVLETVEASLGVDPKVASFVIPLGATVNMDGTAIMQGVATIFIANIYGIHLGVPGYLMVIAMATLSSVGTAGVPGVGLITLSMVLQQVGIPIEGIALIIGIDRLLDMVRTAVNVSGDAMIACIVARWGGWLRVPQNG